MDRRPGEGNRAQGRGAQKTVFPSLAFGSPGSAASSRDSPFSGPVGEPANLAKVFSRVLSRRFVSCLSCMHAARARVAPGCGRAHVHAHAVRSTRPRHPRLIGKVPRGLGPERCESRASETCCMSVRLRDSLHLPLGLAACQSALSPTRLPACCGECRARGAAWSADPRSSLTAPPIFPRGYVLRLSRNRMAPVVKRGVSRETSSCRSPLPSHNID